MGRQDCQLEFETIELDTVEVEAAESLLNSLNSPAVQVDDAKIDIAIDIDLQKVEEDLVTWIILCSNDAEMDDATRMAVAQRRKMWPKWMTKGYRRGLVCWAAFCARR